MEQAKNPLEDYFLKNDGPLLHKWLHYFEIYDRHFSAYRGKEITMVEIGVFHGGSLGMWSEYFGSKARIIGIDISERAKEFESDNVRILIGDQEDPSFLKALAAEAGPIDILLDDGGHTVGQQLTTFRELWPTIKSGGVALIEDLHSNYWSEFGGGLHKPDTFIEFAKGLIDRQNAWHSHDSDFQVDEYTRTIRGLHSYDSIIVVEKGEVCEPQDAMSGHLSFEFDSDDRIRPIVDRSRGQGDPGVLTVDMWQRLDETLKLNERLNAELTAVNVDRASANAELAAVNVQLATANGERVRLGRESENLARDVERLNTNKRNLKDRLSKSEATIKELRRRLPDRALRHLRTGKG